MKYAIVQNGLTVVFSEQLTHKDVVPKAESAGFCAIFPNGKEFYIHVWGESRSLGVKSHKGRDEAKIEAMLKE